MYENCAGGLLDVLVIVQYMHAVYNHERTVRKKTGGAQYKSPKISVRLGTFSKNVLSKSFENF